MSRGLGDVYKRQIPDPSEPVDPQTGEPIGDLGAPIQEPDLESEGGATEAPTIPSGGEI